MTSSIIAEVKRIILMVRWFILSIPGVVRFRLSGDKPDIAITRKTFDSEWYLNTHPDVAHYRGDPFEHFLRHGAYEGRAGRFFDSYWYMRRNADMRFTYLDAWAHYQRFGKTEGRSAKFFYVNSNTSRDGANRDQLFLEWAGSYDSLDQVTVQNIHGAIKAFDLTTSFDIVMRIGSRDDLERIKRAVIAARDQIYPRLTCFIAVPNDLPANVALAVQNIVGDDRRFQFVKVEGSVTEGAQFNACAAQIANDFVCFLTTWEILDPAALFWTAYSVKESPNAAMIYVDEDRIDAKDKRRDPYFKPQFNYELFLSHNMLGGFVVYRRALFDRLGRFDEGFLLDSRYDLAFRGFDSCGAANIYHIPRLLNHVHEGAELGQPDPGVVLRHLERIGKRGEVMPHAEVKGYNRVRFTLPDKLPLVSIVIPTRDRLELLRMAISSVLAKTSYAPFEIIIIDNGSVEPATLQYLKELNDPRVRVLHDNRPFNFSALNNAAVRGAAGEFICMMNNDIEILTPDWLEEMMSFAIQPDVGCVGARLWYPDDTLQHGGVLVGFHGVAGHMHKLLPRGSTGYANRAVLHQCLSAVTAAVMLVRKSIYDEVGGLDEGLAVAFNDVDFCLKVRDKGYRNVYTPFAEMYHHESASRGAEDSPEKKAREQTEIDRIKTRYGDSLLHDPAYNPNLTLQFEDLSLAFPPRIKFVADILLEHRKSVRESVKDQF